MKEPIEEMFLYRISYCFCRIFLTSLISRGLFAFFLGCFFILRLMLSAHAVYLIYFLMMYPAYYLSAHYLAEREVGRRKEKIRRSCFIVALFQLSVSIFAADRYLFIEKVDTWYLIPFLLCLLFLVPHGFLSTLIDVCKKEKADSPIYLIKRNIWPLSKDTGGFPWYFCLLYGPFWCIRYDLSLTALLYPGLSFVTACWLREKENEFK